LGLARARPKLQSRNLDSMRDALLAFVEAPR
jgi:hypothetical protein